MKISMIAAVAHNNVIGGDNKLLWHISTDLKHFKAVTMGKPVVMGRKTYESIGRALPGRENVVITRNANWMVDGVTVVHSLEEALKHLNDHSDVMIIGGGQIYGEAMTKADVIHITEVDLAIDGDAYFPEVNLTEWSEVSRQPHAQDGDVPAFTFVEYNRI